MNEQGRVPNTQLAALMREAQLSQKSLAHHMRMISERDNGKPIAPSHTNVAKWLSGETRRPNARTCQVLVKALSGRLQRRLTLEDVGYGGGRPGNTPDESPLDYPETIEATVTSLERLAAYELRDGAATGGLVVVPEAWDGLLTRWTYGEDSEPHAPVEPRPIGEVDVEVVKDATAYFANADYRYGGGRPRPMVGTFLKTEVLPLLPAVSPSTAIGREYFREVAALTRLAGWTAYDIGEHGAAQHYLFLAFRLARAAGDKALCGRILAGMSHQANFLGHFERAVHLARGAAFGARDHATATTNALFYAMEARALASMGKTAETIAALAAAEQWLGKSDPEKDPEWITYFDNAELHAEFAHCYRDLGQADLAVHHAAESISSSKNLYVRSLSFCRTVLATGHLQANEIEEAVKVAQGVVDTAVQLKSFRVVSYLHDFRKRLRGHSSESAVRDFTEQTESLLGSVDSPLSRQLFIA
ncbi:hypothetical protein SAMN04489727_2149 [Amycolatopsis tolypomycina]|uniref:HTH cro/C1-type domain-containing protein n=1 Tax=Amycolatopsis tolypomycina TaxID=208445 RepID=A0A1H4JRS4_9PSEU|nr:hypothetical protein [Amycolatopsis tolypomycina]SEB28782.1 hypothetical protein SAMN04489727_0012 [Amycolatopsis tolypomycina]SEB49044.1 hypothetical protein SAMN04489727_2149 [Amycolatopsis tolypomycina]